MLTVKKRWHDKMPQVQTSIFPHSIWISISLKIRLNLLVKPAQCELYMSGNLPAPKQSQSRRSQCILKAEPKCCEFQRGKKRRNSWKTGRAFWTCNNCPGSCGRKNSCGPAPWDRRLCFNARVSDRPVSDINKKQLSCALFFPSHVPT